MLFAEPDRFPEALEAENDFVRVEEGDIGDGYKSACVYNTGKADLLAVYMAKKNR